MKSIRFFITHTLLLLIVLLNFSCNDKFYKEKYDVEMSVTNRSDTTIAEIKIDGAKGAKVWVFKNMQPGKTEAIVFNIKRELQASEGSFILTAKINEKDPIFFNTGYFTNWNYQGTLPARFNIYRDSIEVVK